MYLLASENAYISAISYHELYFGALHAGVGRNRQLDLLANFTSQITILPFIHLTATLAAQVRASLAQKATPIGTFDTLIAGHPSPSSRETPAISRASMASSSKTDPHKHYLRVSSEKTRINPLAKLTP